MTVRVPDREAADLSRPGPGTTAGRVLALACGALVALVLAAGLTPARPASALRPDRALLTVGPGVRTSSARPSAVGPHRLVERQTTPPTAAPAGPSESDGAEPGGQVLALVIVGAIVFVLVVGGTLVWASGRRNRAPRP